MNPFDREDHQRKPDKAEANQSSLRERFVIKKDTQQQVHRGGYVLYHADQRQRDPPGGGPK